MVGHMTAPAAALLAELPGWASLVRAPNPGPMTLEGTNTWVLRAPGETRCVVIDPGPYDETHLVAVAERGPVAAILLTHAHPDHVDGLPALAERTGAAHVIVEGETELAGLQVRALATPGHTADSVCFQVGWGSDSALFSGDTILGRGTTVVAYPDGDLGDYLDSLRLLVGFEGVPVLPGHGPALADCGAAARFYLAHRIARLEQVRAARAAGASTAADVVARVYADVDRVLWPAAEWSVRAQLAYLDRESPPPANELDRP
jgi:glyoxylase-like metal-dependent hydrolase (beta-lactamase superfamily II)